MFKKGQAAMEFLMTYGWAILVVLVAIGALAYFGVLNPSRFLPSSCTVAPGIGCDDFQVINPNNAAGGADNVILILRNGMGNDLTNVVVNITNTAGTAICDGQVTIAGVPVNEYMIGTWVDGSVLDGTNADGRILLTDVIAPQTPAVCDVGLRGSRFKNTLNVGYTGSSGLRRSVTGSITTRVE